MLWITCNLPWNRPSESYGNPPKPPNMRKKIKKQFGKTLEQVFKECKLNLTLSVKEWKNNSKLYKKFDDEVRKWLQDQPEIKAYNETMLAYSVKSDEVYKKTFCGQKLNIPGTLIIVNDKEYLIGDINNYGGVCDDCMGFSNDAIVKSYCVVKNYWCN